MTGRRLCRGNLRPCSIPIDSEQARRLIELVPSPRDRIGKARPMLLKPDQWIDQ